MTISVPSIERVLAPYCQGLSFQWQPNFDLTYGQVGSDLPQRLAAILRKRRELVGAELVAYCQQAQLPFVVTSEHGYLNVHAADVSEVTILSPAYPEVQAVVLDAPTSRATGLGFFRLASHAVMHATALAKVPLFLRSEEKLWQVGNQMAQSLTVLWQISHGDGWDSSALSPASALPPVGLTVVWTVPPESLGVFERDFRQTLPRDEGSTLLVRSLPRSQLVATAVSDADAAAWGRAIAKNPVAAAALLLRECPLDELDPLVPLLAEAGNIVWLASFAAQRIQAVLAETIPEESLGRPGSNHPDLKEHWLRQQQELLTTRTYLFEATLQRLIVEGSPHHLYQLVTEIAQACLGFCQSYQVRQVLGGTDAAARMRYVKLLSSALGRLSSIFPSYGSVSTSSF